MTAKTIEQAKAAETAGADYLGSGAVFGTSTKADAKPMELDLFQGNLRECNNSGCCDRRDQRRQCPSAERQKDGGSSSCHGIFACEDLKKEQKNYLKK